MENFAYRSNLLTDSNCAMHWSNNCTTPYSSQSLLSRLENSNYNYNDSSIFSQFGNNKFVSCLQNKYQDTMTSSYNCYSPLDSPTNMKIWTDIEQSKCSDNESWGISYPMPGLRNSEMKANWDYETKSNSVIDKLYLQPENINRLKDQKWDNKEGINYSLLSPCSSVPSQNLEHTLSDLNLGENRCSYVDQNTEDIESQSKKTWALIVGRQGKTKRTPFPPVSAIKSKMDHALTDIVAPVIRASTFDINIKKARFFVIKSYSEDDVYRSIKYKIWCSTENGNRKLDSAYQESGCEMPIYLFFSVNGSGHFCGIAEMTSLVDYKTRAGVWAQGKWKGQFNVRWVMVKDVPNNQLRHIRIETNENKPVTNSRDVTEIPLERGRQVLKIFATYKASSSIYDDFEHYEQRELSESTS